MDTQEKEGAGARIEAAVLAWEGIEAFPHRFGGQEYRLGKREIGHVHGSYLVDIPFPKKVRDEVVMAGLAEPHHILPQSGWISRFLRDEKDVETALILLRRSYELALKQKSHREVDEKENGDAGFSGI